MSSLSSENAVPPNAQREKNRPRVVTSNDPWSFCDCLGDPRKESIPAWDKEFARLLKALQKRALQSPDRFAAEILGRVISSASYVWLRMHQRIELSIRSFDKRQQGMIESGLHENVVNVLMPQLLELGRYIAEIAHIQAATARQWSLAQAKQASNEHPTTGANQLSRSNGDRVEIPPASPQTAPNA